VIDTTPPRKRSNDFGESSVNKLLLGEISTPLIRDLPVAITLGHFSDQPLVLQLFQKPLERSLAERYKTLLTQVVVERSWREREIVAIEELQDKLPSILLSSSSWCPSATPIFTPNSKGCYSSTPIGKEQRRLSFVGDNLYGAGTLWRT